MPIRNDNICTVNVEFLAISNAVPAALVSKGARTEKAGLPARATGTNMLPELRYINKSSAHWQNRLVQVLTGNPLSPVFWNELFIPVSRTCSTRFKIIYFWHTCASKEYTVLFEITPLSGY